MPNARTTRAGSIGCCLEVNQLENQNNPFSNKLRRRSTRRRKNSQQKAINFNEWANKKYVLNSLGILMLKILIMAKMFLTVF